MATTTERLTAGDYLEREDPRHTELIDGILLVNQPGMLHQLTAGAVITALRTWCRAAKGAAS